MNARIITCATAILLATVSTQAQAHHVRIGNTVVAREAIMISFIPGKDFFKFRVAIPFKAWNFRCPTVPPEQADETGKQIEQALVAAAEALNSDAPTFDIAPIVREEGLLDCEWE